MIIKHRDACPELIQALETQARRTSDPVKRTACRGAISRLQADPTTSAAVDQIDVQFSHSDNWAVIHDLRLRVMGHAIHINHLLISSTLNFYCLDTRFLDYGLDFAENGQCHIFNRIERKPIASPLTKAAKDTRKLAELIQHESLLPRQFGFERNPSVQAYVVTHPALRLGMMGKIDNENISVHASSSLFPLLWSHGSSSTGILNARLNAQALHDIASSLAALHIPSYSTSLLQSDSLVTEQTRALLRQQAA